jgi:hypothetical protein
MRLAAILILGALVLPGRTSEAPAATADGGRAALEARREQMSPERLATLEGHYAVFRRLEPETRAFLLRHAELIVSLPAADRATLRRLIGAYQKLPETAQQRVRRGIGQLRQLPPAERRELLRRILVEGRDGHSQPLETLRTWLRERTQPGAP